jgi:hypothetical protein
LLTIAAFSLLVLVLAFAWICLLELRNPMYPRRALRLRSGLDRRQAQATDWPGWLERRCGERRRDVPAVQGPA